MKNILMCVLAMLWHGYRGLTVRPYFDGVSGNSKLTETVLIIGLLVAGLSRLVCEIDAGLSLFLFALTAVSYAGWLTLGGKQLATVIVSIDFVGSAVRLCYATMTQQHGYDLGLWSIDMMVMLAWSATLIEYTEKWRNV